MLNWLMNHVFDRQGYRDMQEQLAIFDENARMVSDLQKRVRASFTDEEWEATKARCEAQLNGFCKL